MKRQLRFFSVVAAISIVACPAFAEGVWTIIPDTPVIDEHSRIASGGDGMLWMTTKRSGVFRYDGSTWTKFTNNNRLLASSIYDVDVAPNGDVWIVSSTELSCFNGETWTSHAYPRIGNPYRTETNVAAGPDGIAWCGVRGMFFCLREGTLTRLGKKNGFPADELWEIKDIAVISDTKAVVSFSYTDETRVWYDNDGNAYNPTRYGVYLFDGNSWAPTLVMQYQGESEIAEFFKSLASAPDGTFWGCYQSSFYRLEGNTWIPVYTGDMLGLTGIAVDSNGNVWGSSTKGASVFNGEKLITYKVLDTGYPLDLATGENDEVWLLANGSLNHYAPESVFVERIEPQSFVLHENYPNPFNGSTTINYMIPREETVTLSVYNCMGQKIRSLYSGVQSAGNHTISWNGMNDHGDMVSSGIYFTRLASDDAQLTHRMMYLK